ncbi:MAG: membrane integrity-associated transporter subunit PqiC [Magnetococcales bacterium]|nr:membrane integrity-associated transporter subunit PqiC [Magnetococcales bacterium]NGZ28016.1 membrane integrity-associated transporter subunit PqiC [Magnetococcales bacterium]
MKNFSRWRMACLVAALFLGGCSTLPGEPSPPTRFYLLASQPDGNQTPRSLSYLLELAGVEVAPYLHRPQLVHRQPNHRLHLAEFDQWAEELNDGVARVLEENLSLLLKGEGVRRNSGYPAAGENRKLTLRIHRFERDGSGKVVLALVWSLHAGEKEILSRRFSRSSQEGVAEEDFNGMVEAMNRLLWAFSLEVVASLPD